MRATTAANTSHFGVSVAKQTQSRTSVERRAEELDTVASVLLLERRDKLAELFTDEDVKTLRHLVNASMVWRLPENLCPGWRPRRCC